MPKTTQTCAVCGQSFTRYTQPARPAIVCGRECQYKRLAENHRAPWLTELNTTPGRNRKVSQDSASKRRAALVDRGEGKSYRKYYGRHEHRVVAEQKLGRPLQPGEIVHHEDRNKRNNADGNLQVLPSRAEHSRIHALERHCAAE